MQCLILAGGLGTRMYPVTEKVPKSLLPVLGRPFLGYQLDLLAAEGIRKVVLSIGHLGWQIRDFAGDGSQWGLEIQYCDEASTPFGTGGAVRLAYDRGLLEPSFFVVYGDSYTAVPFRAIVRGADLRSAADHQVGLPLSEAVRATMVIISNADRWDRSNVLFEDGRLVVYDKTRSHPRASEMRYLDYGVSLLTEEAVRRLPEGPGDLSNLYHQLSVEGLLAGFEVHNRFYEIGSPKGLDEFAGHLLERQVIETEGVTR